MLDVLKPHWRELALSGLIGGLALCTLWVVVPRLAASKGSSLIPTAILGMGIFAATQWQVSGGAAAVAAHEKVLWHKVQADAFAAAKASGKPVLIDMWAEWCEACKKMDATTFADPVVLSEIGERWITLKMDLTEDNAETQKIQEVYGLQSLPTLVLLPPDGDASKRSNVMGYVNSATLINNLRQFSKPPAE
jgi:thiol:disulfide interchange protein DsbD